jgi:hypothetical protein
MASYGCAAPTFGRATFYLVASHERPKVGATRGATAFCEREFISRSEMTTLGMLRGVEEAVEAGAVFGEFVLGFVD